MAGRMVLSEEDALELLAFLVTAARTQVDEAAEYGSLRLLTAAGRVAGLIAAEMIATSTGLGFLIYNASNFHQTDTIFVGIVTIGILWLLTDRLVLQPIERWTVERWGLVSSGR